MEINEPYFKKMEIKINCSSKNTNLPRYDFYITQIVLPKLNSEVLSKKSTEPAKF